jgi:hypothetical protein
MIKRRGFTERQVRKKPTKTKKGVGQPTKKLLSDLYDEVLRLRRKILEAQSAKPGRVDRHASK